VFVFRRKTRRVVKAKIAEVRASISRRGENVYTLDKVPRGMAIIQPRARLGRDKLDALIRALSEAEDHEREWTHVANFLRSKVNEERSR